MKLEHAIAAFVGTVILCVILIGWVSTDCDTGEGSYGYCNPEDLPQ